MKQDSLGNRMKSYECVNKNFLIPNTPTIIRIDGKAFHSFTKGMKRPFDEILIRSMNETSKYLCENIMGCKLAYVQSDEITLLLTDYDTIQSQAWFGGNIQKIVSVSASMATMAFNKAFTDIVHNAPITVEETFLYYAKIGFAMFDSRVFQLPKEEVINNFIWRQQDATRNSILSIAYSYFSSSETHGKSCNELQEMLMTRKQVNWNDFKVSEKRGRTIVKENYLLEDGTQRSRWIVDEDMPILTQDRDYINKFVFLE